MESRILLRRGTSASLFDYLFAGFVGMREWGEIPVVNPSLEPPPVISLFVGVKRHVDEACPVLGHVLKEPASQSLFGLSHRRIGLAESETPFAVLQLMSMLSFVVPSILNGGANAEVVLSVVKSVPVHVVNNRPPRQVKFVQVAYYLVKWDIAT